jgi:arylsulfatase A-like enzyme
VHARLPGNPPGIKPGQRIDTPVSLIDMAPTICELAEIERRNCFDGESLLPLVRVETTEIRSWALASYSGVTSNTMSWMLRKGNYKFIRKSVSLNAKKVDCIM